MLTHRYFRLFRFALKLHVVESVQKITSRERKAVEMLYSGQLGESLIAEMGDTLHLNALLLAKVPLVLGVSVPQSTLDNGHRSFRLFQFALKAFNELQKGKRERR